MKNLQSHIIQQQHIEISFDDVNDGMGMQNEMALIFYEKLQPRMEILLDELFGKNYYVSIDNLEIDCGVLNKKDWEEEFVAEVIFRMKAALVQINKKEISFEKMQEASAADSFFLFLEEGILPWNKRITTMHELEQMVLINEGLVLQLKKLIVKHPKVAERLACQFSNEFIAKMIAAITGDCKREYEAVLALMEKLTGDGINKYILDAAMLMAFSAGERETIVQEFSNHIYRKTAKGISPVTNMPLPLVPGVNVRKVGMPGKVNMQTGNNNGPQEIYINNAGLVLLHPFLERLFEALQITTESKWTDELSKDRAILLLDFLATGSNIFEEFNLMLNKILCGTGIDENVLTGLEITDTMKSESEGLLTQVIVYWSVLKNTSIDGLREAFLQRSGKLSRVDRGWLLQVEQRAMDVLLGHLPWGIGLIKLPWMHEMLFVEWV